MDCVHGARLPVWEMRSGALLSEQPRIVTLTGVPILLEKSEFAIRVGYAQVLGEEPKILKTDLLCAAGQASTAWLPPGSKAPAAKPPGSKAPAASRTCQHPAGRLFSLKHVIVFVLAGCKAV